MGYCASCDKHSTDDEKYCLQCGGNFVSNQTNSSYKPRTRSSWWYLVPLLLGIIGGLIAYFVVRKDDPKLAKNCLIIGVVVVVIGILFSAVS